MSGGGIGGTLGTLAGAALAPATGGLSIALPAIGGAAGGALGAGLTGGDVGRSALAGGVGGALPGVSGELGLTGELTDALGAAGANAAISGLGGALTGGISGGNIQDALLGGLLAGIGGYTMTPSSPQVGGVTGSADTTGLDALAQANNPTGSALDALSKDSAALSSVGTAGVGDALSQASPLSQATPAASPGFFGKVGNYISDNPLESAIIGSLGLAAAGSLLPGEKAKKPMGYEAFTNPNLPQYQMSQNTGTPYTGDWYKYGETAQVPMYNAMPVPAYAKGGMVDCYAKGGAVNPLEQAYKIGEQLGQKIKGGGNPLGLVAGAGKGQEDAIDAKLSAGEYVIPAEVVSQLGDGSSEAGGLMLDKMVKQVRSHKTKNGKDFPAKAKNPLAYLTKGVA